MNFNEIILDLRKERGISQQQVAEAIGISQSTIAKIEIGRNEATASTIRKLADFFGVSSDYILGLSEDFESVRVQSHNPAFSLTAEERKLVEDYRGLGTDLKNLLKSMIATWQTTDTISTKKIVRGDKI